MVSPEFRLKYGVRGIPSVPGIPSKGVPQLADGIHELPDLPEQWQKAPQSERGYYLENHVVDTAVERFERVTAVCHLLRRVITNYLADYPGV